MAKSMRDKLRDEVARDFRENDAARMERRDAEAKERARRKAEFEARYPDGPLGGRRKSTPSKSESPAVDVGQSAGVDFWLKNSLPRLVEIAAEEGPLGLEMLEGEMRRMQMAESQRAAVRREWEAMREEQRIADERVREERKRARAASLASQLTAAALPSVLLAQQERTRMMKEFSNREPVGSTGQPNVNAATLKPSRRGEPSLAMYLDDPTAVSEQPTNSSSLSVVSSPVVGMPKVPAYERGKERRRKLVSGLRNAWDWVSNPSVGLNQYGDR